MTKEMTYDKARMLISEWGITDDLQAFSEDPILILVCDVGDVINAIMNDTQDLEEDVFQSLDRNGIKWMSEWEKLQ